MARGRSQNRQKRPQKKSGKMQKNNFETPLLLFNLPDTYSHFATHYRPSFLQLILTSTLTYIN